MGNNRETDRRTPTAAPSAWNPRDRRYNSRAVNMFLMFNVRRHGVGETNAPHMRWASGANTAALRKRAMSRVTAILTPRLFRPLSQKPDQ